MCISGSVGKNGANDHPDVKTVQILLNVSAALLGLNSPLAEDGAIGPSTLTAIETFQRKVMGMAAPDALVSPNSPLSAGFALIFQPDSIL